MRYDVPAFVENSCYAGERGRMAKEMLCNVSAQSRPIRRPAKKAPMAMGFNATTDDGFLEWVAFRLCTPEQFEQLKAWNRARPSAAEIAVYKAKKKRRGYRDGVKPPPDYPGRVPYD